MAEEEGREELAGREEADEEPHHAGGLEQEVEVARARADGGDEGRQVAEGPAGRRRARDLLEQRRRQARQRRAPPRRGGRVWRPVTQQAEVAVGGLPIPEPELPPAPDGGPRLPDALDQ